MRLFLERGYAKVAVSEIAQQAGLATPTVYASTGGKSAILATLISERQYGDPVVDATLAAVRKAKTARQVIEAIARGTRINNERYHDISQVMVTAAAADDAAAEVLERSDQWYRKTLSHAARRLKTLRALRKGLTEARAVDVLWFFFGREPWHLFIYDRQWSWDEAEVFLTVQASTALIEPGHEDGLGSTPRQR